MARTSAAGSVGQAAPGPSLAVDFDALLAELRTTRQAANEGYTTEELRERFGWSVPRCTKIIRAAMASGRCRRARKVVEALDGRMANVPAYVFEG